MEILVIILACFVLFVWNLLKSRECEKAEPCPEVAILSPTPITSPQPISYKQADKKEDTLTTPSSDEDTSHDTSSIIIFETKAAPLFRRLTISVNEENNLSFTKFKKTPKKKIPVLVLNKTPKVGTPVQEINSFTNEFAEKSILLNAPKKSPFRLMKKSCTPTKLFNDKLNAVKTLTSP